MTTTEKNLALEELKKELEKAKNKVNDNNVLGVVMDVKSAIYNYSNFVSDWRILDFIDKIITDEDVEQIIIDKVKEDGLRGVVWFLDNIDRYNCDNYYYIIDDVFNELKEIDAGDVLDIISDVLDYLETK